MDYHMTPDTKTFQLEEQIILTSGKRFSLNNSVQFHYQYINYDIERS